MGRQRRQHVGCTPCNGQDVAGVVQAAGESLLKQITHLACFCDLPQALQKLRLVAPFW